MSVRPKIFIASPLFNPPQIEIIRRIEDLLKRDGFDFYSARLHSGSDKLSPEDRKQLDKWDPVFQSNEDGLNDCQVMIAVLEYALPDLHNLNYCISDGDYTKPYVSTKTLELPDAGTVWEAGYFRAQGKIVIGFHSTKRAQHLNLMLSHGCDALVSGFDNLEQFLVTPEMEKTQIKFWPPRLVDRIRRMDNAGGHHWFAATTASNNAALFNWSVTERWDAENKEVE